MKKKTRVNLKKLSKSQLIYIIDRYKEMENNISERLEDADKRNITLEQAVKDIRKMVRSWSIDLNYEHLADFIQMERGKITGDEFRKRVLGIGKEFKEEN